MEEKEFLMSELVETLRFYAKEQNYCDGPIETLPCGCCTEWEQAKVDVDMGEKARAMLEKMGYEFSQA